MKHWTEDEVQVGDEVSFRNPNLWNDRAIVTCCDGQWIWVEWKNAIFANLRTKEWRPSLIAWKETV